MKRQRGAALLMAVSAVAVVSILATVVAATVLGTARVARAERARESLGLVAESGAELAIARLSADRKWTGSVGEPVPGGSCRLAVQAASPEIWDLTSRAGREGRECVMRVRVQAAGREMRVTQWQMEYQRNAE